MFTEIFNGYTVDGPYPIGGQEYRVSNAAGKVLQCGTRKKHSVAFALSQPLGDVVEPKPEPVVVPKPELIEVPKPQPVIETELPAKGTPYLAQKEKRPAAKPAARKPAKGKGTK